MKKTMICLTVLCFMILVSCSSKGTSGEANSDVYDWGVTLTAENITPESMTLVCTQSGGSLTGELETGEEYFLEVKTGDKWMAVPTVIDDYGWDSVAYIVKLDGETSWEISWAWLYGQLEPGKYRIGKGFMDFRETGDYDTAVFYAEFVIE